MTTRSTMKDKMRTFLDSLARPAPASLSRIEAAAGVTHLDVQIARDIHGAVVEAMQAMRLPAKDTQQALRAVEQMICKGEIHVEDLRGQLGHWLPGAFQIGARAIGATPQELGKMLERREVTAARFLPALTIELRRQFEAAA